MRRRPSRARRRCRNASPRRRRRPPRPARTSSPGLLRGRCTRPGRPPRRCARCPARRRACRSRDTRAWDRWSVSAMSTWRMPRSWYIRATLVMSRICPSGVGRVRLRAVEAMCALYRVPPSCHLNINARRAHSDEARVVRLGADQHRGLVRSYLDRDAIRRTLAGLQHVHRCAGRSASSGEGTRPSASRNTHGPPCSA